MDRIDHLREYVVDALRGLANPADAGPMQAYMKTDMPFLGVKKPARVAVERELKARFRIEERDVWEQAVLALWSLPHREEKYIAIAFAKLHRRRHCVPTSLPLFKRMIRGGAWWDLVDDIASNLVGEVWSAHRAWTEERMDRWIADDDPWVRRTAIIGQLKHKDAIDAERLYRYCATCMHEKEFFIRKAIGWALRQHSDVDPEGVREFLLTHRDALSGLSFREGSKHLVKAGLMER